MKKLFLIISTVALTLTTITGTNAEEIPGNSKIQSYSKVKKILLRQVYHDHRVTLCME